MSNQVIKEQLLDSLEEFKCNIKSTLETSSANEETKYIVEELARQTYYVLNSYKDIISKNID